MARITEVRLRQALDEAHGNVSGVARVLGVSRRAVHAAVDRFDLDHVVREARTLRVEKAEDVLDRAVDRGEGWAVALTLKCLGKHLGYVERIPDVASVANLDALKRILVRAGAPTLDDMTLIGMVMDVKAEMEAERAG